MARLFKDIFFVVGGFIIGYFLNSYIDVTTFEKKPDLRAGSSTWVNPLLECNADILDSVPRIRLLKKTVSQEVLAFEQSFPASTVSVYYKDLNSGAWFGVKAKEEFAVASLSKVPVLAKVYKMAEDNPAIFSQSVIFEPQKLDLKNVENNVEQGYQMIEGQSYTVKDLLQRMILHSDNYSTVALVEHLKIDLGKMFKEFGIVYTRHSGLLHLTSKSYGAIFRILYNSTYLSQKYSEMALELLSRSDFDKGIRSSVSGGVRVANKFGARHPTDEQDYYQLHDCGIVYTEQPYLLCIMTKGKKLSEIAQVIQSISKTLFKHHNQKPASQ